MYRAKLFPFILFVSFAAKLAILGGGYAECLMLAILAGASHLYLKTDKDEEIMNLRTEVAKLENKINQRQEEFDLIKTYVSTQKINGAFKSVK